MRTRASLAAIVTACACGTGAAYAGGGPGDVYNDYAADGVLSCNHSRADLVALLRSGTLNQYGDPLTLTRLKLAVRKQLAGGCRRGGPAQDGTATGASGGGASRTRGGRQPQPSPGSRRQGRSKPAPTHVTPSRGASTSRDNSAFLAGRGLILALLVAALAFGGWLTKRALATRD